jgi:hypothetical protein
MKGLILFTDVLKICTATRIFPNLLNSKDLRGIIIRVCSVASGEELNVKLGYKELEDFLRSVAGMAFPRRPPKEQYKLLMIHMRNPCYLRYNLILDTDEKNLEVKNDASHHGKIQEKLALSPYRKKLIQKKTLEINEALKHKGNSIGLTSRFSHESSHESSPVAPFKEVLSARNSGINSFRSFNSTIEDKEAVLNQIESGLKIFCNKISSVFDSRSTVRGIKKILMVRKSFLDRQAKVKLAFKIWAKVNKN